MAKEILCSEFIRSAKGCRTSDILSAALDLVTLVVDGLNTKNSWELAAKLFENKAKEFRMRSELYED